jgi:threonine aldolase
MIPLSSDTETKPTTQMRHAMATAEVGDEQKGEDPTVNLLLERTASLLGKEAALFFPGGTMCNLVSIKVHTRPADAVFADHMSHIVRAESAGAAFSSGVLIEQIPSARGVFTPRDLELAISKVTTAPSPYSPVPSLLCIEQTHNFGGGSVWKLNELQAVTERARLSGLKVHIDGARLLNAVVATNTPARDFAACADSVWIDFTKGLGAPVGAVLAGSRDFIKEARRHKHIFGGALRQAGVVAAGCLYALDHHVERLKEDHDNARYLAEGLNEIGGVRVRSLEPETNMVFFDVSELEPDSGAFIEELKKRGVQMGAVGGHIRAVTHLDVSRRDVDVAISAVAEVARQAAGSRAHREAAS